MKKKIAFIKDVGTFYYRIIPFSLKNVEAKYQRMVTKIFKGLIGRNMEAYIDDILIKSLSFDKHIRDLEEVFEALRRNKMKLNLPKYEFGIKAGKFLRFTVSKNGIKLNLKKLKALMTMNLPKTIKEVQMLIGWIVVLNIFISKMADRCLLFFKSLPKIIDLNGLKSVKWPSKS